MQLTQMDIELIRRYLVIRSAIKGLNRDKQKISESKGFEFGKVYCKLIEEALLKANDELMCLNKYPLELKITDQPTVYQAKIGNRIGFIEMSVVEITEEVSKLLVN